MFDFEGGHVASGIQIKPKNAANQTFHVTARAAGNLQPFLSDVFKREFLSRFDWYLGSTVFWDAARKPYEKLVDEVAVLGYCVMDNHFHLIVHQFTSNGMERLMRRVQTSYAKFFIKHSYWRGPVFQGRYAADPLRDPDHLREMLGYAILNHPIKQLDNQFCSNAIHVGERPAGWVRNDLALGVFGGVTGYRDYMNRTGPARVESKLREWRIDPAEYPYRPI